MSIDLAEYTDYSNHFISLKVHNLNVGISMIFFVVFGNYIN